MKAFQFQIQQSQPWLESTNLKNEQERWVNHKQPGSSKVDGINVSSMLTLRSQQLLIGNRKDFQRESLKQKNLLDNQLKQKEWEKPA